MSNIVILIKDEILALNKKYMEEIDKYNHFEEHIGLVLEEAVKQAEKHGADLEIVRLGALLHDIALVKGLDRKDHNITGAKLARELLEKYNYPSPRIEKVIGCVINHRSPKNATNNEEQCVADADILAHFGNLGMCLNVCKKKNMTMKEIKQSFEDEFNDLSERAKDGFSAKYNSLCEILFEGI